jgi:hypothetical protein
VHEDDGSRVAKDRDSRAAAHDRVDGAALPAELAKIQAAEDTAGVRPAAWLSPRL